MEDVAERLGRAVELAGLSRRRFGKLMAELDTEKGGRGYAQLNEYLQGRAAPPLEVVEAMAGVLGVRPAWLAFGDGEPLPEDEAAVRARRGPGVDMPLTKVVQKVLKEEFEPFDRLSLMRHRTIWDLWTYLHRHREEEVPEDERDVRDADGLAPDDPAHPQWATQVAAARAVGRALWAPFEAMGVDPDDVGPVELQRYVETACSAVLFLVDQDELRRSVALGARTRVTIE